MPKLKISTPHPVAFTTVNSLNQQTRIDASALTFVVRVIKADGSSVAGGATGGIGGKGITQPDVTNAIGCCYYTPVAADINVLGEAMIRISATGMETREIPVDVVSWDPYNAVAELQVGLATAASIAALPTLAAITAVIPTAVQVRDALLTYALRTGRTVRGHLRRVDALLFGKATGLLGALATLYQPGGSVTEFTATQNTGTGARDEVNCTTSETP
jgi:hypothetical protein